MFHLLVNFNGWDSKKGSLPFSRVFEYTDDTLSQRFAPGGKLSSSEVSSIPALFMTESGGEGDQRARVGEIERVIVSGSTVSMEYRWDAEIEPISNAVVEWLSSDLRIDGWEFTRTHWAIKDVDLFRVLLQGQSDVRPSPKVFKLDSDEMIEEDLISVMMPFSAEFDDVHSAIQVTAASLGMKCSRADDIWNHDAIIQDIVSLINRSRIVICDCSGRNPNVFYEAGIAHTLGRDVILIAQSESDIPFDLRHLRYLHYLNNGEGRRDLSERLEKRIDTLRQTKVGV